MTEQELDNILTFRWPKVVRRAVAVGGDWEAGFAKSIARHGKRKNWRPTNRQAHVMHRMLAELDAAPEPDFDVIEE